MCVVFKIFRKRSVEVRRMVGIVGSVFKKNGFLAVYWRKISIFASKCRNLNTYESPSSRN